MFHALLLSLLFTSLVFANSVPEFPFIGFSVSNQRLDTKIKTLEKETTYRFKYGKQTQDWRTTFTFDYTKDSYQGIGLEVDKILLDGMFNTPKLRPYLGAVAGYMKFDDTEFTQNYKEHNSYYYGGNFGFIIYATDYIDIDIGYHYYIVDDLDFLDNIHGATFAIHYFF